MGLGAQVIGRNPGLPGSRECFGAAVVTDHDPRLCAKVPLSAGIDNRLHIAAAM